MEDLKGELDALDAGSEAQETFSSVGHAADVESDVISEYHQVSSSISKEKKKSKWEESRGPTVLFASSSYEPPQMRPIEIHHRIGTENTSPIKMVLKQSPPPPPQALPRALASPLPVQPVVQTTGAVRQALLIHTLNYYASSPDLHSLKHDTSSPNCLSW